MEQLVQKSHKPQDDYCAITYSRGRSSPQYINSNRRVNREGTKVNDTAQIFVHHSTGARNEPSLAIHRASCAQTESPAQDESSVGSSVCNSTVMWNKGDCNTKGVNDKCITEYLHNKADITFISLNVCGLVSKLNYPDFYNFVLNMTLYVWWKCLKRNLKTMMLKI